MIKRPRYICRPYVIDYFFIHKGMQIEILYTNFSEKYGEHVIIEIIWTTFNNYEICTLNQIVAYSGRKCPPNFRND